MQSLHLSKLEEDRLAREENDRFREKVREGQFDLFDDDINYAIKTRTFYDLPEIAEAVKELVRQCGRKTPARTSRGTKLILVLTTGCGDA